MVDEREPYQDAIAYLFQVGYMFRELYERDHGMLLEFSRHIPLTPQQIRILFLLKKHNEVSVNEVARKLNRASPTVVLQLNAMEELGYVKRVRSTKDRRQVLVHVTEKGRQVLKEIGPLYLMRLLAKIRKLSKDESQRLRDALEVIFLLLQEFFEENEMSVDGGFSREHAGML